MPEKRELNDNNGRERVSLKELLERLSFEFETKGWHGNGGFTLADEKSQLSWYDRDGLSGMFNFYSETDPDLRIAVLTHLHLEESHRLTGLAPAALKLLETKLLEQNLEISYLCACFKNVEIVNFLLSYGFRIFDCHEYADLYKNLSASGVWSKFMGTMIKEREEYEQLVSRPKPRQNNFPKRVFLIKRLEKGFEE